MLSQLNPLVCAWWALTNTEHVPTDRARSSGGICYEPRLKWFGDCRTLRRVLALLAVGLFALPYGFAQESSDRGEGGKGSPCPAPGAGLGLRPGEGGGPTKVSVGVFFNDVTRVVDVSQTFTADIYLAVTWRDPRIDTSALTETTTCQGLTDAVWHPLVLLVNGRSLQTKLDVAGFLPDGRLIHYRRLYGEFSAPLDLRRFPFDEQSLTVTVESLLNTEAVQFEALAELEGSSQAQSLPGWDLAAAESEIDFGIYEATEERVARYHAGFSGTRHTGFYVFKLLVPLALIVAMSWGVFWIDPSQVGPQIGVSATSMLTLIAYQFAQSSLLPRISYLTVTDKYTFGSSLLVFSALVQVFATSFLAQADKVELARAMDRRARWIAPLGFVVVCIVAFLG